MPPRQCLRTTPCLHKRETEIRYLIIDRSATNTHTHTHHNLKLNLLSVLNYYTIIMNMKCATPVNVIVVRTCERIPISNVRESYFFVKWFQKNNFFQ